MKRFRYNARTYLVAIIIIIMCLVFQCTIAKNGLYHYLYELAIIVGIITVIDCLFTIIIVDNNSITLKKIYKSTTMHWNDIDLIVQGNSNNILLFGKKKISISTWTKNYDVLLKLIVSNVSDNNKTRVNLAIPSSINK